MSHSRVVALLGASSLALVLHGCGGQTPSSEGATTPETASSAPTASEGSTSAGEDPCKLLTSADVERIAGRELEETHPLDVGGQLPACVWGSLNDVGVQAGRFDASLWAQTLPEITDMLRASGIDAENLQKLDGAAELIESGRDIPPDEACGLFSELVELNGMPPGTDLMPTVYPNEDNPQAVTLQGCRGGTYVTVMLVRPDFDRPASVITLMQPIVERLLSA